MRRIVITWLLLCGVLFTAWQLSMQTSTASCNNLLGVWSCEAPSGGGGYTGPGDVVSGAIAWWGLRCYNTAYAGNVADIWDAATGSTTETLLTCSSGGTINQTVNTLATTCASACRVKTLYEQSGALSCGGSACDLAQATNADRPALTLNCINTSLPCITVSSSVQVLARSSSPTQAQPFTYVTAGKYNGSCGGNTCPSLISDSAGNYVGFFYNSLNNHIGIEANSSTFGSSPNGSIASNKWYTHQSIFNGTSTVVYQDAVSVTLTGGPVGTNGMANTLNMGNDTFSDNLVGAIAEVGVWAGSFSAGQATNMCHNQFQYWATATSC